MSGVMEIFNRKPISDDDWSLMTYAERQSEVNYWVARGYSPVDPIDGVLAPRFERASITAALDAINGKEEPALSNGIPGLLGLGGVSAKWGLDRVPWWIWAGLAAGIVLMLSSRRKR
jgi:hypothetical protein